MTMPSAPATAILVRVRRGPSALPRCVAVRWVGEHTVYLAGAGERLELRHVAEDRAQFAKGAVRAALWARGRKPGRYDMADVLGFKD